MPSLHHCCHSNKVARLRDRATTAASANGRDLLMVCWMEGVPSVCYGRNISNYKSITWRFPGSFVRGFGSSAVRNLPAMDAVTYRPLAQLTLSLANDLRLLTTTVAALGEANGLLIRRVSQLEAANRMQAHARPSRMGSGAQAHGGSAAGRGGGKGARASAEQPPPAHRRPSLQTPTYSPVAEGTAAAAAAAATAARPGTHTGAAARRTANATTTATSARSAAGTPTPAALKRKRPGDAPAGIKVAGPRTLAARVAAVPGLLAPGARAPVVPGAGTGAVGYHAMAGSAAHMPPPAAGRPPFDGRKKPFLLFPEALAHARSLGLGNKLAWEAWSKNGMRLANVPACPNIYYKDGGWQGWGHWLGTGNTRGTGSHSRGSTPAKMKAAPPRAEPPMPAPTTPHPTSTSTVVSPAPTPTPPAAAVAASTQSKRPPALGSGRPPQTTPALTRPTPARVTTPAFVRPSPAPAAALSSRQPGQPTTPAYLPMDAANPTAHTRAPVHGKKPPGKDAAAQPKKGAHTAFATPGSPHHPALPRRTVSASCGQGACALRRREAPWLCPTPARRDVPWLSPTPAHHPRI